MIIRVVRLFVVLLASALLGTGCSLHDSARTMATAEAWGDAEHADWSGGQRRADRLSRDASRALRPPAMKPEEAPDIWTRARLGFAMTEALDHPRVGVYVEHYRRNPNIITVSSARAKPFAYFILTEIERRGLPSELLLLPIVESGYAAEATSRSLAAGIWQFIPSTGEHFGLIQDDWYDGRRDVYQSTHAALNYLESLHARFGDWYLALAAYNYGQGNVARAIAANAAAGKPTDYWSLTLSDEAMGYVPRLLALSVLVDQPARHGVTLPKIANSPYVEPVQLGRQADLEYVAELARMETREIMQLNPGYRRTVTHPHSAQHLLLPAPAAQRLQTALRQNGPEHPLLRHSEYQVRAGDNLGRIAQQHGVTVTELRGINRLNGDTIHVGQKLRVPASGRRASANQAPAGAPPARPQRHTVQAGESLWGIGRRYGVGVTSIQAQNRLAANAVLQPGQVLDIPRGQADTATRRVEYRIRPGDSLGAISRRFQIDVSDLKRWNALNGDGIRAGETLTLYVAANLAVDG
jgi:membrane-bound lytic murein transglycosylase D